MTDRVSSISTDYDVAGMAWDDDVVTEARAIQVCLRHLLREARTVNLDMTARVLAAAMDAVDMDLDRRKN